MTRERDECLRETARQRIIIAAMQEKTDTLTAKWERERKKLQSQQASVVAPGAASVSHPYVVPSVVPPLPAFVATGNGQGDWHTWYRKLDGRAETILRGRRDAEVMQRDNSSSAHSTVPLPNPVPTSSAWSPTSHDRDMGTPRGDDGRLSSSLSALASASPKTSSASRATTSHFRQSESVPDVTSVIEAKWNAISKGRGSLQSSSSSLNYIVKNGDDRHGVDTSTSSLSPVAPPRAKRTPTTASLNYLRSAYK
jgi:hypothetical protein